MQPISRSDMQARRAAKIEADRQYFVKQIINTIYNAALGTADTHETTSYKYVVSSGPRIFPKTLEGVAGIKTQPPDGHGTMVFNNSFEIIEELTKLFPDCTVKYMSQIQDIHGTWHEISAVTGALIPFITRNTIDVILIDWS